MQIEKLIPGGQALTTLPDGRKLFLWNALPGEIVDDFTFTKQKSHYCEGIATKISHPSPHRITPKDACYLSTSPWQIMDYAYELSQKQSILQELFRQNGLNIRAIKSAFIGCKTWPSGPERPDEDAFDALITDGQDFFYRNKMEYALYWDNATSKISLAFHNRGTHQKLPIETSSLERPEIFAAAQNIVASLNARHEEARQYQSILLRCNQQGIISGGLLKNGQSHPTFPNLTDTILGYTYSYSPNGFFQINLPVYELALQTIKPLITTDKVLDLYSGVGTIGLSVARDRHLTLVENNKSAYAELVKNCLENTNNSRPILSNSEDALDFIENDQTVILDPPRAGCDKKLLDRLLTQTPPTIIYLSCNPATQARDVAILSAKYKIKAVSSFNFFPRTPHIENLIVLGL